MSTKATSADDSPNVVVFGEAGVGKSSLINMIAGRQLSPISSDASGCTFKSTSFLVELNGKPVRFWDTAGLNEGDAGTVVAKDAIINLYKLLKSLENGISLLVYCIRGPRIRDSTVTNYKMFYHGLCQEQVPVVLVVTGLEAEEPMDEWWTRNKGSFKKQRMTFNGQACVTATKGKVRKGTHMFEQEYEESTRKVRKLVDENCHHEPWQLKTSSLAGLMIFIKIAINIGIGVFNIPPFVLCQMLYEVLKEHGGISDIEARKIANEAETMMPATHELQESKRSRESDHRRVEAPQEKEKVHKGGSSGKKRSRRK
jgi:small GTP-binding protein